MGTLPSLPGAPQQLKVQRAVGGGGRWEALALGICGETATPRERSRPRGGHQTEASISPSHGDLLTWSGTDEIYSGSSPQPKTSPISPAQPTKEGWAEAPSPRIGSKYHALADEVPLGARPHPEAPPYLDPLQIELQAPNPEVLPYTRHCRSSSKRPVLLNIGYRPRSM